MLFQTPPPITASELKVFSPVPKYMMLVFDGFWQMLAIARLPKKSFTNVHVAGVAVMSFVFQIPPSIPPSQTVLLVASARSTQIARTRPLVTPFPGLPFPSSGPTTSLYDPRSVQPRTSTPVVEFCRIDRSINEF